MSRWTQRSVLAVGALTALAGMTSAQEINPARIPPITVTSYPGESLGSTESLPPLTMPELPQSIRPRRSRSPLFVEPGVAKPVSGSLLPAALVTQPSGIHLSRPVAYSEELPYEETVFGLAARAPSFIDQAAPLHVFRAL